MNEETNSKDSEKDLKKTKERKEKKKTARFYNNIFVSVDSDTNHVETHTTRKINE